MTRQATSILDEGMAALAPEGEAVTFFNPLNWDREDPIKTVGLGLGYRFGPYVSLWGGYLYENRDSTIYRYSYDYNVYTLSLVVGY